MPDIVWRLERAFWLEGVPAEGLRSDSVMVFPHPTGILKGAAIEKSLKGGTPWKEVAFYQLTEGGTGDVAAIGYRAVATRAQRYLSGLLLLNLRAGGRAVADPVSSAIAGRLMMRARA